MQIVSNGEKMSINLSSAELAQRMVKVDDIMG